MCIRDSHYSDIKDKLKKILTEVGVPIQEKTDEELYDLVLPKGSKQEKAFIRLVVTFVTLVDVYKRQGLNLSRDMYCLLLLIQVY